MSKGNKSQTEERNSHKCFVILHCSNWMWFHFLMKFWNETAAGNPVSVSVKIITFLLFVQDWESFGWSNRCRASKSITSDIFLVGSERSRAKVGAVSSRAKDSGHYTFSRCRLPLSGVPLWRSHPVVHGRHCRSRRRDRGMSSIHAPSRSFLLTIFLFSLFVVVHFFNYFWRLCALWRHTRNWPWQTTRYLKNITKILDCFKLNY